MRDRLITLLQSAPADCEGNRKVGAIADYLLANGVIVPPCKVGDVVYRIREYFNDATLEHGKEVIASKVDYIHIEKTVCNYFYSLEMGGLFYSNSPIGKTVFLTREEAERALAERSEK